MSKAKPGPGRANSPESSQAMALDGKPKAKASPGLLSTMEPRPDHGEASYVGHGRLAGKAAIVTGGDSGIGRAVALAFAREGADVLISYLDEEEDALDTERWIVAAGRRSVRIPGDIGYPQHCGHIVEEAIRSFGRLDILVNNAGQQWVFGGLAEISPEDFEQAFRVNLLAPFCLCKAALPHLRPGASIINTASSQAFLPSPSKLPYASRNVSTTLRQKAA